ncbi:MAG TPA: menaquinone biosynthesis decarboxylase [Syntrophorhabdaceae bacterium]|nr:menaquinone biosynthesis decarboxylase [Syntrophorhabdaceae bacterium]
MVLLLIAMLCYIFLMHGLKDFIDILEKENELIRLKKPVSKDLEITEITDRICKATPDKNKAILFENVVGYDIPIVTNIFGSEKRISLCFGVKKLEELNNKITGLLKFDFKGSIFELLKRGGELFNLFKSFSSEKIVDRPACQQVIFKNNFSLNALPIPHIWPKDGGRYITLPQVITCNPETGKRNVGMYRLQAMDDKTLIVHWQRHKHGREHEDKAKELNIRYIPSAIVIGGDPLCIWAASAPLSPEMDEYGLVSFFRGKPLEMAKCITQPLSVPAHADIVIEGYIDIEDMRMEGPFGDHTGYYTPQALFPSFHITAITMKKDPIYPATITGIPPMEDFWMGKAVERLALPFLKMTLPEIQDINMPSFGVFHNLLIVSIKKRFPGHARKVINALWGMGLISLTKAIVVVDHDVDVQDLYRVGWYVLGNVDWLRDTIIMEGPVDQLDHATDKDSFGGKIGIDATRKFKEEGYNRQWPEIVKMDEEVIKKVDIDWEAAGIF